MAVLPCTGSAETERLALPVQARVEGLLILLGLFAFQILQSVLPGEDPKMDSERFEKLVEKGGNN